MIFVDITLDSFIFCLTAVLLLVSLFAHMYVLVLKTAYKQATITGLIQNISLGRWDLEQRKVLKRENFQNVQFFWKMESILLQNYFCDC